MKKMNLIDVACAALMEETRVLLEKNIVGKYFAVSHSKSVSSFICLSALPALTPEYQAELREAIRSTPSVVAIRKGDERWLGRCFNWPKYYLLDEFGSLCSSGHGK